MSKQLTFPKPTDVTKIHKDGKEEKLRYGQYESVMIVKENGWHVDRGRKLVCAYHPVTEVECEDGSKLIFDEPFYTIEKKVMDD